MHATVFRPGLFNDKRAIVTGGGTGIGLAIARILGRLGCHVILGARDADRLDRAVAGLAEHGVKASARALNIRDEESVERFQRAIADDFGEVDFLINNAGGQFPAKAEDISPNGMRAVFDLNVQGVWLMTRRFARAKIERQSGGRIVNIVFSHTGPMRHFAHGQAARAAVVNLTKTLALEWGPKGILVNAIGPGPIATDASDAYRAAHGWGDGAARLPLRRAGTPEEIGEAVAFLCSPAASFITGILLPVDGGDALVGTEPVERSE